MIGTYYFAATKMSPHMLAATAIALDVLCMVLFL
jgi:hypothetical protein